MYEHMSASLPAVPENAPSCLVSSAGHSHHEHNEQNASNSCTVCTAQSSNICDPKPYGARLCRMVFEQLTQPRVVGRQGHTN